MLKTEAREDRVHQGKKLRIAERPKENEEKELKRGVIVVAAIRR